MRFIIHQTKRRTGRVILSKLGHPLLRENVRLLKGRSKAQLDWVTRCISTMTAGLGSPAVWCHFSEAVCLSWQVYCSGGQEEIRGRRLPGLIGGQRELMLGSPAFRQKGKECQFYQQAEQTGNQESWLYKKLFPFVVPIISVSFFFSYQCLF
jgi:hypothetical protein